MVVDAQYFMQVLKKGCPRACCLCVLQAAPWLMSQGVQLVCLGTGSTDLEVSGPCL
jgi:hypothetical protein